MAAVTLVTDGEKMATRTTARTNDGMVRKNSVVRISRSSIHPPWYPASAPSVSPTTVAQRLATTPISSDTRPPWTIPARMSRPDTSVPSGNPPSGRENGGPTMSKGSRG